MRITLAGSYQEYNREWTTAQPQTDIVTQMIREQELRDLLRPTETPPTKEAE